MTVCDEYSGRLTAFLHRELPLMDSESIERHLASCAECRAKLDRLHLVTRNLRKQVLTEPSARVRKQLQQRMEHALRPAPKAPETPRPAQTREGWHIVATEPQALTLTPVPALPAPPMPALLPAPPPVVNAAPAITFDAPLARANQQDTSNRISTRATARSARQTQSRERLSVLLCVALAVMTALLGVFGWRQLQSPTPAVANSSTREAAARQQRWQDRVRVRDQDQMRQSFLSRELKLPLDVSSPQLYLLPHHDPASGETFLALYREEDVEALSKDPTIDATAFRASLQGAVKALVSDGQVQLPARLPNYMNLDQYIGAEHRVAILPMGYRIEVWAAPRLQRYLANDSTLQPVTGIPASQGLPPERP